MGLASARGNRLPGRRPATGIPGQATLQSTGTPGEADSFVNAGVAGIAAASTNNGLGVAGAAPDAAIMPLRVLNAEGVGDGETIAEAIRWATENGADVINM